MSQKENDSNDTISVALYSSSSMIKTSPDKQIKTQNHNMSTPINLTPHTINEATTGDSFAPSGIIARVGSFSEISGYIGEIPVFTTVFGDVEFIDKDKNLVEFFPIVGQVYIVSAMVKVPLQKAFTRSVFVSPGELVRDDKGNPIGCKGFSK